MIVLGVATALLLYGLLLSSVAPSGSSDITQAKTAAPYIYKSDLKSLVQITQLSKAQQFLHELQSSPTVVLLFLFAFLSVRLLPYKALLFLHLQPWYWHCHPPNKLRVSLWRDSNILIRQTRHSLDL